MKKTLALIALTAALSAPAWAATKTVTLFVRGMTCPACPITVKMALIKINGVKKVVTNFKKREAIVTFNDAKTSVKALMKATADAGYPSTVEK